MATNPYSELAKKADALITLYYRKPGEDQLNAFIFLRDCKEIK